MNATIRIAAATLNAVAIAGLMVCTPSSASAYADPGSGAFVYQAAYAAFLGGTFYFRRFLERFWRRNRG